MATREVKPAFTENMKRVERPNAYRGAKERQALPSQKQGRTQAKKRSVRRATSRG